MQGLKESIKFLGLRSDIPDLMQGMDLFLFPSGSIFGVAKVRLSEHKSKRKLAFFVLSSESILFKSSEKNDLAKRIETFLLKFVSQKELTGVL